MITEVVVSPKGKPSYPVMISPDIDFARLISYIKNKEVLVVTNTTIADLYLSQLDKAIKGECFKYAHCILADGEAHKNSDSLNTIYQHLLERNYTRNCVLVALGGGVIGDITGFAAATYQRGTNVIQIPTTLLSQVDSSVGGKTAINHPLGKNMIGAFFQPQLVMTSTQFLKTLPQREFAAGMAEVIKYGCIIDADFFAWLEQNAQLLIVYDPNALIYAIAKSCELKAHVVSLDEEEKTGVRALLNLGHTFGHAIECCQNYQGLKHGEAVAIGMVMAAELSQSLGFVDESVVQRIRALLQCFSLPVVLPQGLSKTQFIAAMLRDKKNTTAGITLILLDEIGQAKVDKSVSENALSEFLSRYFD
ncbi:MULTISPECIES: 3-dehydroquinate synthase [Cysteiniphilum]|uniref:3-dehydroquinate synthase n=1 Tax=Cysteiniphilum litorale TaxID=2056700 RepID=A0A8J3E9D6_9GAMM|nr:MULTISPECIES: 3-dehydroquinate synthase [Cysteiniphilum]GGG02778.1 3-dehydroquinate synthase [Cysteiniphilum litorale]